MAMPQTIPLFTLTLVLGVVGFMNIHPNLAPAHQSKPRHSDGELSLSLSPIFNLSFMWWWARGTCTLNCTLPIRPCQNPTSQLDIHSMITWCHGYGANLWALLGHQKLVLQLMAGMTSKHCYGVYWVACCCCGCFDGQIWMKFVRRVCMYTKAEFQGWDLKPPQKGDAIVGAVNPLDRYTDSKYGRSHSHFWTPISKLFFPEWNGMAWVNNMGKHLSRRNLEMESTSVPY